MKISLKRSWSGLALLFALAFAPGVDGIAKLVAGDADACPQGEGWLECRAAAGDQMAVYRLGRSAYENARESGDFTEALRLSRQLQAAGDKNGERLLKMVHMQLGWGAHKDPVQAYVWLSEDMHKSSDYLGSWRKQLAEKMTPEQLGKARALAGE